MIDFDKQEIKRLQASLDDAAKRLPIELKIAVNATAKKTKLNASKEIRKELAAPAKEVKKIIGVSKASTSQAVISAGVTVKETARISLKDFGGKQTQKGVSAKVSKSRGRTLVPGGFKVRKFGGHFFKRRSRARLKIDKLHGPSPWGVFVKRKLVVPTGKQAEAELSKQIERRIRFNVLKRAKLI